MSVVVVFSGGLDSTVLLSILAHRRHPCVALSFDYGQRHRKELDAACALAKRIEVPHTVVNIASAAKSFAGNSSQTNKHVDVPDGHYEDASMRATVVPNRNMIMLALAAGHAIAGGHDTVAYGAHAGDHAIYPDCRPSFVAAMHETFMVCHYDGLRLWAPFLQVSKAQIVRWGAQVKAPFGLTWSCYKGKKVHCGTCGTCSERREAFRRARVADPTVYA